MSTAFTIRTGTLDDIFAAHRRVPELDDPKKIADYKKRIAGASHIALIAEDKGAPIGFKLGYALSAAEFYSWVGGVDPAYRKHGAAQDLLDKQEELVAAAGYSIIRVKSMNCYPGMLRLLVKNGYRIDGYEANNGPDDCKILFCKSPP